jgi:hypothetical protein
MRAIRTFISSAGLPLVASGGSVFAWTNWRPPVALPGGNGYATAKQLLGPLGSGLSSTHGLATTHGTIGLAAGLACVGGVVGLLLPGRLRLLGAAVIAVAGAGIAWNGLSGYLSASHIQHGWSAAMSAFHTVQKGGGIDAALKGVSGAISRNALAPSGGAAAAGGVTFLGGIRSLGTGVRSLRAAAMPRTMPPGMALGR